jgi:sodium transport system permease protein
LPKTIDQIFKLEDPNTVKPKLKRAADELRDTFVRTFPFILMLWLVAGAIQPAVDVTAGEKERGTMETLLISPAERSEIVFGKFLAVSIFAFVSVVWNVIWLSIAAAVMSNVLGFSVISVPGVIGCVLMGLPLAMFFSALCLALGVFAKSTKEGQYYLIPLMLGTMPLAMMSLLPGLELNMRNAWVPVTGAMLLQQKLLAVSGDPVPWMMFVPVLASLAISVAAALWLAVRQFNRESVLFRETGGDKGGLMSMLSGR